MNIKVLSQNVMCWQWNPDNTFEKRNEMMKKVLLEHGADLLCLQEVTKLWKSRFDEYLDSFDCVFRYRGETDFEAVPIYYRKDRFEKKDGGWFWLSDTPEKESVAKNAGCRRITCWALLCDRESGKEFICASTHLDNRNSEPRIQGIKVIRKYFDDRFGGKYPIILGGDFNARPEEETISIACEFLNDTRNAANVTTDALTYFNFGREEPYTIDYIFASNEFSCNMFDVILEKDGNTEQSDHRGVIAELELK